MNKKHNILTPAQAVQRDLEAEGSTLPSHDWPTDVMATADTSIWY
jgi:hypothetical protein